MGINSAKLLSATIALATLVPGIALTAPAQAQSGSTPSTTTTAPASSTPTRSNLLRSNKLSSAQRQQIKTLLQQRNKEITGVLDQSQSTQYNQALASGKRPNQALQGLNLRPDQKTSIQSIVSKYNDQIRSVVSQTPSQSAQPSSDPSSQSPTQGSTQPSAQPSTPTK